MVVLAVGKGMRAIPATTERSLAALVYWTPLGAWPQDPETVRVMGSLTTGWPASYVAAFAGEAGPANIVAARNPVARTAADLRGRFLGTVIEGIEVTAFMGEVFSGVRQPPRQDRRTQNSEKVFVLRRLEASHGPPPLANCDIFLRARNDRPGRPPSSVARIDSAVHRFSHRKSQV